MAKLELTDLSNIFTAATAINANSAAIEAAIENTLSRDGTSPNEMNATLDMNNNRIINLPEPISDTEPVRRTDLGGFIEDAEDAADRAEAAMTAAEADAITAQQQADRAEAEADRAEAAADAGEVPDGSITDVKIYTPLVETDGIQANKIRYRWNDTTAPWRSLMGKIRERVSLQDINRLAGDGTTDVRSAFQEAFAAGVKIIDCTKQGTYIFPDKVPGFLSTTGVRIQGASGTLFKSTVPTGTPAFGDAVFFLWDASLNIHIDGVTFDMNSITTTNTNTCAVGAIGSTNFIFSNNKIVNGRRLGLTLNGSSQIKILDNYMHRAGGPEGAYQNEALLISIAGGTADDIVIEGNTMHGWATLLSGTRMRVLNNKITNYGYGAGISFNVDAGSLSPLAMGNYLGDSSGLDVNTTHPAGIESWADGAIITNNYCFNNSGVGIMNGGSNVVIANNRCVNNGNGTTLGAGIAFTWQLGLTAVQNSIVANNRCYDTGPGYQKYGYDELAMPSAPFANNKYIGNHFVNNVTKDFNFSPFTTSIQFDGYTQEGRVTSTVSVASGASNTSITLNIGGASVGDHVEVSMDQPLLGCVLTGYVQSPNTVYITLTNLTGVTANFTSAVFTAKVRQRRP